jgi:hypothetical protein
MLRSGRSVGSAALLLLLTACHFPYGFKGGGLPPEIDTMAVLPFDNKTASSTVQQELLEQMRGEMRRRLGVREAPEAQAKSIARGTILEYQQDIPVGFSTTTTSARRRLQITVDVEIVDVRKGKVLLSRKGLRGEGEYPEGNDAEGRRAAIQKIVNDIVDGAQSQW